MNKSLRSLLSLSGQTFSYGVGFFGRQIIVYLTLPLLTNLMTQQEYGIVSLVTSFLIVVNTLTNFGLPAATVRLYNDSDDKDHQQDVLGSSQALFFIIPSLTAIGISLFSKSVSLSLLGDSKYSLVIQIVAILLVFETMNYFGNLMLRIHLRPGAVNIHNVVYVISQMGLAIVFIKYLKLGVLGYWLGYLIGGVIGILLMIWFNRHWLVFKMSRKQVKELLKFGLPLIPVDFSFNFLQLADRFMILSLLDFKAVAIYTIGYRIGSFVNFVLAPFSIAWPIFAFSKMKETEAKRIYRDSLTYVLMGSIFVALIIFIFRVELIDFVSPESYQAAVQVVPWISLSMIAYGIYPILSLGPRIAKHTRPLAWISTSTTLVNIILNVILIPAYGIKGAAAATLISYLYLSLISYFVSRRYYDFQVDGKRIGLIIIATCLTASAGVFLPPETGNPLLALLIKVLILLLYPVILLLLRFITPQQIGQISVIGFNEVKAKIQQGFKEGF